MNELCNCFSVLSVQVAVHDVLDEMKEIIQCRNIGEFVDEASDIAFGVGRLLGAMIGIKYVRVVGDGRHVHKIEKRMGEYGCIRSARHLVDGKCPSHS